MKKLLFILFVSAAISLTAQTTETVNLNWGFSSNPSASGANNSSVTIEVGDTVFWTWVGNGDHNIQSQSTANETFDSGSVQPAGFTFSYTFQSVGENPYRCGPHAQMNGVITVVADGTLSLKGQDSLAKFSIYPNPSSELLNISLPRFSNENLNIEVFDVLGKRVFTQQLGAINTKVNISKWNSGVYLVRLTSADDAIALTKRFVKL